MKEGINAAARHHNPGSFLQWIIAIADRLASGFERSEFDAYNRADEGTSTGRNHYQARMLSLFESIALEEYSEVLRVGIQAQVDETARRIGRAIEAQHFDSDEVLAE